MRTHPRSLLRAATVSTLVAGALTLGATTAHAGPDDWVEGTSDQDTITNCTTGQLGAGVIASTAWRPESDHVPYVGERFVIRMTAALVGNPCSGQVAVLAELMAPTGLIYADDATHPVRWGIRDIGAPVALTSEGLSFHPGSNGGVLVARDDETKAFVLDRGEVLDIEVPVVATRPLKGIATLQPECEDRRRGTAPCPAAQSGDHWQTAFRVGGHGGDKYYVTPYVGLFAQAGAAPGPPGPGHPGAGPGSGVAKAASSTKARWSLRAGRPWSVAATVTSAAAVAGRVAVTDRGTVIARGKVDRRGRVTLRLPRLTKGKHRLAVRFTGSDTVQPSTSRTRTLTVR